MEVTTKPPPPLSPALQRAVGESVMLSEQIGAIFPKNFKHSLRNDFGMRCMSLALDHREAIILLIRHGARSSAYALVRAAYEACTRGVWMMFAAEDQEIKRFNDTGVLPGFDSMVRRLSKLQSPTYASLKQKTWESFSDYAHGGWRQLRNWSSPEGIQPVHPDSEVIQLLMTLDGLAIQACAGVFEAAQLSPEPLVALLEQFRGRAQAHKASNGTDASTSD